MYSATQRNVFACTVGLALTLSVGSTSSWADQTQDEIDKQVAKIVADALSARVGATVAAITSVAKEGPIPDNSAWGNYTRLRISGDSFPTSNTNLYIVGYDRTLSRDWIAGVSAAVPDTEKSDTRSFTVTPYAGYIISPNLFAIFSPTYSEARIKVAGTPTFKTHSYGVSGSLNAQYQSGPLTVKGRAGLNWSESSSNSQTEDITGGTLAVDVSYAVGPSTRLFGGVQMPMSFSPSSVLSIFGSVGVEQMFTRNLSVSLSYDRKFADDTGASSKTNVESIALVARLAF